MSVAVAAVQSHGLSVADLPDPWLGRQETTMDFAVKLDLALNRSLDQAWSVAQLSGYAIDLPAQPRLTLARVLRTLLHDGYDIPHGDVWVNR